MKQKPNLFETVLIQSTVVIGLALVAMLAHAITTL